jgi:MoxR-like ATPase
MAYPHQQAATDVAGLERGLKALRAGDRGRAAKALTGVGHNAAAARLSEAAFERRERRLQPEQLGGTWAGASHVTPSPQLWRELAALRGRRGAPEPGPWIAESLERHLERSRADLQRRLDAMAQALEDLEEVDERRLQ